MLGLVENLARQAVTITDEPRNLEKLLDPLPRDARVLDVGCGFGTKLRQLEAMGFHQAMGVDVNPTTVRRCQEGGLDVLEPAALRQRERIGSFDVLLFSHVIEHFPYEELKRFLEAWFEFGRDGAAVVVITPLLSAGFFNEFDHVKPYSPRGLTSVFTSDEREVQIRSAFCLDLRDLRFRRSPRRVFFPYRGHYLGKRNLLVDGMNLGLAGLFWLSRGALGQRSAWLGHYRLTKTSAPN